MRKKVSLITLLSTIIHGIVGAVTSFISIISIVLMIVLSGFIKDSAGMLNKTYYDSVTGGWEVLFGLIGTFLGVFVLVVLALIFFFVLLPNRLARRLMHILIADIQTCPAADLSPVHFNYFHHENNHLLL